MAVTGDNGFYIRHSAAADSSTGHYYIEGILWNGMAATTDSLQVKDGAGNIVFPSFTVGAAYTYSGYVYFPVNLEVVGLKTDTMTAGTVTYFLKGMCG